MSGTRRPGPASGPETASRIRLTVIGVLSGALAGLFGLGGGVLIVPALVAWCRRDQRQAVATSLMALGPLAMAGVVGYAIAREVDVWIAVPLAAGSMIGAGLGAKLLSRAPLALLRWIFAAVALGVAVRLLVAPGVSMGGPPDHDLWRLAILLPVGVVIGLIAALTGIGGGAIMVPVMQLGFSLNAALAKGTSLLVILPTAILGGWRNLRHRNGVLRDAAWLGLTGMAAAFGTSAVSVRMPGTLSDVLFGLLLVAVGLRTVWGDLRAVLSGARRRVRRARERHRGRRQDSHARV